MGDCRQWYLGRSIIQRSQQRRDSAVLGTMSAVGIEANCAAVDGSEGKNPLGAISTASAANAHTRIRRSDSQRQTVPNHFHLSATGENPAKNGKNLRN